MNNYNPHNKTELKKYIEKMKAIKNLTLKYIISSLHLIREDLKKIRKGSYKNYFSLTIASLCLILGVMICKSLGIGLKFYFISEKIINLLPILPIACLLDIFINPFKTFKLLIKMILIICLIGIDISMMSSKIDDMKKSHREHIKTKEKLQNDPKISSHLKI